LLQYLVTRLPFDPESWPAPLALVGGSVRDALLGRERFPLDLDLVTPAPARKLGAGFAVLDAEREIARVILADGLTLDIARQQGEHLEADLQRRDFTINAIAYSVNTRKLIDPWDGQGDLKRRELRAISEANLRDDPLRVLRGYRQAAQLDFTIQSETRAMLIRCAPHLKQISAERVREELAYLIACERGADWLLAAHHDGVLVDWLPELKPLETIGSSGYHHLPLLEHTLEVVRQVDQAATDLADWLGAYLETVIVGQRTIRQLTKWAALLHDIAKPATQRRDPQTDQLLGFPNHEIVGAEMTATIFQRLKFSKDEERWVSTLVRHHLRPGQLSNYDPPSARAIYRLFRDLGNMLPALLVLAQADRRATLGPKVTEETLARASQLTETLLSRYFTPDDPMAHPIALVDGKLLMAELQLSPGPQIGKLLATLQEAQAIGEVQTRDQAFALARKLLESSPKPN
jgi:tRNA nucleotidyltransferase (CCA-adding enzyme)